MSFIELKNLSVAYNKQQMILQDFNLNIEKGELVSLLGPSGCGKTTTLRTLAGLVPAQSGEICVAGKNLIKTPVHQRNFGMVFQSYALFPHMSVRENIAYGLKLRKENATQQKEKVDHILKLVGLSDLADRYPQDLSGGQRQRVALARALVIEPQLLLLDEPLSNLDAKLRVQLRNEIRRIQQEIGITTLFVTHDQEECFAISDKVAVMNQGVIEQYDHPEQIYRQPKTAFVANFVGFETFIPVQLVNGKYQSASGQDFSVNSQKDRGVLTIRPEEIIVLTSEHGEDDIEATVETINFLGKSYQYDMLTKEGRIPVQSKIKLQPHEKVYLHFPQDHLILL